jgi:N-sulfoglucosamine sulfohydrolase
MHRLAVPRFVLPCLLAVLGFAPGITHAAEPRKPNLLLITVDDMSCDSIGAFGCKLPGTSPHVDRLAAQGLRFAHAHVQVGNCMPSRNVLLSGRYPVAIRTTTGSKAFTRCATRDTRSGPTC